MPLTVDEKHRTRKAEGHESKKSIDSKFGINGDMPVTNITQHFRTSLNTLASVIPGFQMEGDEDQFIKSKDGNLMITQKMRKSLA